MLQLFYQYRAEKITKKKTKNLKKNKGLYRMNASGFLSRRALLASYLNSLSRLEGYRMQRNVKFFDALS